MKTSNSVSCLTPQYPKVIGHRGCAGLAPENTLVGFQKAIDLGVDGIELDVHVTKDHKVVVYHDTTFNCGEVQTIDRQKVAWPIDTPIRDLTWAEVQSYNLWDQVLKTNHKVPALDQVLTLVQRSANKKLEVYIEAKTSPVVTDRASDPSLLIPLILDRLDKHHLQSRARLLSFDVRSLFLAKQRMPHLKTQYLTDPQWTSTSKWLHAFSLVAPRMSLQQFIRYHGGAAWSPHFKDSQGQYLTTQQIKAAQAAGLEVIVWTPNTKEDLQAMIDRQVDGIITDRPDILSELLHPMNYKTS